MAERLDICLTDATLKMEDVDNLLKASVVQDPSPLQRQMVQLRQGRQVEALHKLLPVSFFMVIILFRS